MFLGNSREPLMVQAYLPALDGDKRIVLVNGEPVGAVNRIPSDGSPFKFPCWRHCGRDN